MTADHVALNRANWDELDGQLTLLADGQWQLTDRPGRLAHSYPWQAARPGLPGSV